MQKTKKILIYSLFSSFSLLPIVAISAGPITTPSNNEEIKFITKPISIREIEQKIEKINSKVDEGQWTHKYSKKDWSQIFDPKIQLDFAKKYGWHSIEEYTTYLQYKYENFYGKESNEFGYFNKDDQNWIAWHTGPTMKRGGHPSGDYLDGIQSPTRPTWKGSEKVKSNNINTEIPWYAYDQGGIFFIFDDENVDNGWKRLVHTKRIVPVAYTDLLSEANSSGEKRNYYMVDGELIKKEDLSKFTNYFYVSTSETGDFVKDYNGWKILITDNDKKKLFDKVLNPTPKTIPMRPQRQGYALQEKYLIRERKIEYSNDYIKNKDFSLFNKDEVKRAGKYKIVYKYDKYTNMMEDPNLFLPHEKYSAGTRFHRIYSFTKYGDFLTKSNFTHEYAGGGYMHIWVEDGKGGRKIYKSLQALEDKVTSEHPDGKFVIYGNWHHVFPENLKSAFENISEIYNDSGLE